MPRRPKLSDFDATLCNLSEVESASKRLQEYRTKSLSELSRFCMESRTFFKHKLEVEPQLLPRAFRAFRAELTIQQVIKQQSDKMFEAKAVLEMNIFAQRFQEAAKKSFALTRAIHKWQKRRDEDIRSRVRSALRQCRDSSMLKIQTLATNASRQVTIKYNIQKPQCPRKRIAVTEPASQTSFVKKVQPARQPEPAILQQMAKQSGQPKVFKICSIQRSNPPVRTLDMFRYAAVYYDRLLTVFAFLALSQRREYLRNRQIMMDGLLGSRLTKQAFKAITEAIDARDRRLVTVAETCLEARRRKQARAALIALRLSHQRILKINFLVQRRLVHACYHVWLHRHAEIKELRQRALTIQDSKIVAKSFKRVRAVASISLAALQEQQRSKAEEDRRAVFQAMRSVTLKKIIEKVYLPCCGLAQQREAFLNSSGFALEAFRAFRGVVEASPTIISCRAFTQKRQQAIMASAFHGILQLARALAQKRSKTENSQRVCKQRWAIDVCRRKQALLSSGRDLVLRQQRQALYSFQRKLIQMWRQETAYVLSVRAQRFHAQSMRRVVLSCAQRFMAESETKERAIIVNGLKAQFRWVVILASHASVLRKADRRGAFIIKKYYFNRIVANQALMKRLAQQTKKSFGMLWTLLKRYSVSEQYAGVISHRQIDRTVDLFHKQARALTVDTEAFDQVLQRRLLKENYKLLLRVFYILKLKAAK